MVRRELSTPTIYLHIGTPKTGTTAIQHYGIDNCQALANQGVYYYPKDYIQSWHGRGHHYPMDIVNSPATLKFLENSQFEKVVISSEGMVDYTTEQIETITDYFSEFNVSVIIYIRRQDHLFHSLYNQYVKWRYYCKATCDELAENLLSLNETTIKKLFNTDNDPSLIQQIRSSFDMLDYYKIINRWSKFVGKDNINIRIYENDKLYQANIVSDFYRIFNLEIAPPQTFPNMSLDDSLLDFLYLFNLREVTSHSPLNLRQHLAEIIWRMSETRYNTETVSSNRLSNDNRKILLERYSNGNKMIANEYLNIGELTLFNNEFPPDDLTYAEIHPEQLLEVSLTVIENCLTENISVAENIRQKYEQSTSWKITKPLRQLAKLFHSSV